MLPFSFSYSYAQFDINFSNFEDFKQRTLSLSPEQQVAHSVGRTLAMREASR